MRNTISSTLRTLLFFLAAGMFLFSCKDDEPERSSEASITSLTLTVEDTDYAITFTDKQGKITVPYATPLPATATVKAVVLSAKAKGIKVGDSVTLPASGTVTLTVTAEDDKTKGVYTLTVEKASASKEASITSFTFEVAANENMALDTTDRKEIAGTINEETKEITFPKQSAYVYLNRLKASFTASAGAVVQVGGADQESGVTEQDFTSSVSYAVRAQDGITEITYTVTLTKSKLATIPDPQFRAKLKELFPAAFKEDQLDIMHDEVVNNSGILNLSNQAPKLTSLKGIEFFTALTGLYCDNNSLTSLDVSANTALEVLYCDTNSLTSLDVRLNTALTQLSCRENALETLDVSANTALTQLSCRENALETLDVSANTALEVLYCDTNSLTSLDVSANTALTGLYCGRNSLPSLDVRANTALTTLNCFSNSILSLYVSKNKSLTGLYCDNNALESLDVSANTALVTLNCTANSISSLDVSANTALVTLNCAANSISSLDVSKNTSLERLDCNDNVLESLDIGANTALTRLFCDDNKLTSLDVSSNTSLTQLYCHDNRLTYLDMTGMRRVEFLNIGAGTGTDNPLATLRVNTALQDNTKIVTMKTNRGAALTVTTVNDAGTEVCADYTPMIGRGSCNDN